MEHLELDVGRESSRTHPNNSSRESSNHFSDTSSGNNRNTSSTDGGSSNSRGSERQSPASVGVQNAVVTSQHRIVGRCGLMVAAGVWSAQILADATAEAGWAGMLQPRRGHLLELLQPPAGMPVIKHGIMEMAYTKVSQKGLLYYWFL